VAGIHQSGVAALAVAVVGLLAAPAAASATHDSFTTPEPLVLGYLYSDNNSGATAPQAGERLFEGDTEECDSGLQMDNTIWYRFTGTGRNVTLGTTNTTVDTMVAVYAQSISPTPTIDALLGCNDDADGSTNTSRLTVPTVAGNTYLVQIGSFDPPGAGAAVGGPLSLFGVSYPPTDDRADASNISSGTPFAGDNRGASDEDGEDLVCEADGNAPMRKTVWKKFTVDAEGDAVISASGFDTVMQVYRSGEATPFACNDDGVPGTPGPSRLRLRLGPGEYFVQVGGYGNDETAEDGNLTLQFEFGVDFDLDKDGSNRPADCNDANPGIRPGAPEVLDDGIDQNCDGDPGVNLDRDGDGFNRPSDCNDTNAAIRPNAAEIPANDVDENCDGIKARASLTSGTYAWNVAPNGLTMTQLTVRATRGMRIAVSCRGSKCFKPVRMTAKRSGNVDLLKKISKKRRTRSSGSTVTLRLTEPNTIGKVLTLKFRRNKKTKATNACSAPNTNKRIKCP
jgi:hypothetical protein